VKFKRAHLIRQEAERLAIGNPEGVSTRVIARAVAEREAGLRRWHAEPDAQLHDQDDIEWQRWLGRDYLSRIDQWMIEDHLSWIVNAVTSALRNDDRYISVRRDSAPILIDFDYATDEEALAHAEELEHDSLALSQTADSIRQKVSLRRLARHRAPEPQPV
jgi:hypothetical protein